MSSDLKHTIYNPTDCLSEKILFDYIDNKLNQKERHIVEKHLLDCEMCSDALEGLELVKDRNRITLIKEAINKRISESAKKEAVVISFNYKIAFSVAATIALLIVGVFFFNKINLKEASMSGDLAQLKENESSPPPPPSSEAESRTAITESTDESGAISTVSESEPAKIDDQETTLEEVQQPGYYKNSKGTGDNSNQEAPVEIAGNNNAYDATITPRDDRKNNQLETVSIPKTSAPEREKNEKLDDSKRAEEKSVEGASGGTYGGTTAPDEKQKNTSNNVSTGENISLAKKSESNQGGKYRTDGKLFEQKDKAKKAQVVTKESSKSEDKNVFGVISTPQSASQDADELNAEVFANTSSTITTDSISQVLSLVEQMPEFPGGKDSLLKFIVKNFNYSEKVDPKLGQTATKIYVQFIVGKDGNIINPKIVKGISPELDKEAIRVVKMMPKWKPGKQYGVPVNVSYNLPIQLEVK